MFMVLYLFALVKQFGVDLPLRKAGKVRLRDE